MRLADDIVGPDVLIEAAKLEFVGHGDNVELKLIIPDWLLTSVLNDTCLILDSVVFDRNEWIHLSDKLRISQELPCTYFQVEDTSRNLAPVAATKGILEGVAAVATRP